MVSFNHSCSDDKSNIHAKSEEFSAEKPPKCPIDKLIDGVQFVRDMPVKLHSCQCTNRWLPF